MHGKEFSAQLTEKLKGGVSNFFVSGINSLCRVP